MSKAKQQPDLDDIALYFGVCSDVFGQLAATIKVIERDVNEHSDIKKMLTMCFNLASDFENNADCYREDVERWAGAQ